MNRRPVHDADRGDRSSARRIRITVAPGTLALALASAFASLHAAGGRLDTLRSPGAAVAATMAAATTIDPARASTVLAPRPAKGSGFDLPRHVIAGGGGSSSGGAFAIAGTIGQPDADPLHPATGGVFAVSGGFWVGSAAGAPAGDTVFTDGFEPARP